MPDRPRAQQHRDHHNSSSHGGGRRHHHLVQSTFLLLGIAVLLPWNAFISAKDYFFQRLCFSGVESTFAIVFNVASVLSLGLLLVVQWRREKQPPSSTGRRHERIAGEDSIDEDFDEHQDDEATNDPSNKGHNQAYTMVMGSLGLNLSVFVGQCLLVLTLDSAASHQGVAMMILTSVGLSGLTGSIANAGIVMTCADHSNSNNNSNNNMMGLYFQGQAVGGLLVAVANFMAATMEDPAEFQRTQCHNDSDNGTTTRSDYGSGVMRSMAQSAAQRVTFVNDATTTDVDIDTCSYTRIDWAVFGYFFAGSLLLVVSMVGYRHVYRLQQYDYETVQDNVLEDAAAFETNAPNVRASTKALPTSTASISYPPLDESDGIFMDPLAIANDNIPTGQSDLVTVYKAVQAPAWCIFLTFVVTLAMFPGWTSQLQSQWRCQTSYRLSNDLYTPMTFVLFNAGDLAGRVLSGRISTNRVNHLSSKLVTAAFLRIFLALLLLTCQGNLQATRRLVVPLDAYSLLIQFMFALSNGFLVTLSFAHAPNLLESSDAAAKGRMSEILSFALSFGLLVGSVCCYPVSKLGQG